MDRRDRNGLRINVPPDMDFEFPQQMFLAPSLTRLKNWVRRAKYNAAKIMLKFQPAVYIYSELTFDDRESGAYNSKYIDSLLKLNPERRINWDESSAALDRKDLRPIADDMIPYLHNQTHVNSFELEAVVESFLEFISDQSRLTVLHNEKYNIFSSFGQSEKDFLEACSVYGDIEKSERAQELAAVVDRELQQLIAGLRHDLQVELKAQQETRYSQIEDLELSCKRLLNKAISLHVLNGEGFEEGLSRSDSYNHLLRQDADDMLSKLDRFNREFQTFADDLIERFGEIEVETNDKVRDLVKIDVPLSSCSLQLLRIALVWLPVWSIRSTRDGAVKDYRVKAF